jgi:hypothetical protein
MKKYFKNYIVYSLLSLVAISSCGGNSGTNNSVTLSSAKAITSFSFGSPVATGRIDEGTKTITVVVPFGTNITALVASFVTTGVSVKVGSVVQVSGETPNDFSDPNSKFYTVTAADGTTLTYTVTILSVVAQCC